MSDKPKHPRFQTGIVIVQFLPHATKEQIDAVLAAYGMTVDRLLGSENAFTVKVAEGTEEASAEVLSKELLVDFAEPEYLHDLHG